MSNDGMSNSLLNSYTRVSSKSSPSRLFNAQRSPFGGYGSHAHFLHQPNQYRATHFRLVVGRCVGLGRVVELAGAVVLEGAAGVVGSLHPNQPGVWQVLLDVGWDVVVVIEGAGDALGVVIVLEVVVVESLQPNHPGVSQVVLEVEDELLVVDAVEVVVSSRHPHHPGVLHVSVLVLVLDVSVLVKRVVVSVPLLSKNFQA
jgi:hypothetical protein